MNYKRAIFAMFLFTVLLGCRNTGGTIDTDVKEANPRETDEIILSSNGAQITSDATEKFNAFHDHMNDLKSNQNISSLDWSKETERYVYSKQNADGTLGVYYGDYKRGIEQIVAEYKNNTYELAVSISPLGTHFLINQLTNEILMEYKSELFSSDVRKISTATSFGVPLWTKDGNLVRGIEYYDKYPTRCQARIIVIDFESNGEITTLAESPFTEKRNRLFILTKIEGGNITYEEYNLKTKTKETNTIQ